MSDPPLINPGERIALVSELENQPSKKFLVRAGQYQVEAFVIRHEGKYYAYRNRCSHAGTPLDWTPNEFFDETGELLLCRTHGALYDPATGGCRGGPCKGKGLEVLRIQVETTGEIRLAD